MATQSPNSEIMQYRIDQIEASLVSISKSLEKLTSLEARHVETREALERAFNAIKDTETRVRVIEMELPTLKLIRGWVLAGVISCASLLGITLFKIATGGH